MCVGRIDTSAQTKLLRWVAIDSRPDNWLGFRQLWKSGLMPGALFCAPPVRLLKESFQILNDFGSERRQDERGCHGGKHSDEEFPRA